MLKYSKVASQLKKEDAFLARFGDTLYAGRAYWMLRMPYADALLVKLKVPLYTELEDGEVRTRSEAIKKLSVGNFVKFFTGPDMPCTFSYLYQSTISGRKEELSAVFYPEQGAPIHISKTFTDLVDLRAASASVNNLNGVILTGRDAEMTIAGFRYVAGNSFLVPEAPAHE